MSRTVGIDVGGPKKGFHLIALERSKVLGTLRTRDPAQAAEWCRAQRARCVAVDAPCRWRPEHAKREAEVQLYRRGISCYWTPTEAAAISHPTDFYGWIKNGMALYQALRPSYPLFDANCETNGPVCLETFPYAISKMLRGPEDRKKSQRLGILSDYGIHDRSLSSIDNIDAALCALCAQLHLSGKTDALGDEAGGWIVVPAPDTIPASGS